MTETTENRTMRYTGDGSTVTFPYSFTIADDSDLVVISVSAAGGETIGTLGIDYTVTGAGDVGGGDVVMTTAPASGTSLVIVPDEPATQATQLRNQGPYFASVTEDALDKRARIDEQQQQEVDRSLKIPLADVLVDGMADLPFDRANKYLGFDSAKNPIVSAIPSGTTVAAESLVQVVDTIAGLKALTAPSTALTYRVRGYYAAGDGGGGEFRYNAADSSTDNGGTIIAPTVGSGRWNRLMDAGETRTVSAFGAKSDEATNDSPAIQAAIDSLPATGGIIWFPDGGHYLGTKITLKKGVRLLGQGVHRSYIVNALGAGASTLVETADNSTDVEITGLQFKTYNASDVCVSLKGSARGNVHHSRFYNASGLGTAILLDRNGVAGAYNHYIIENDIDGMEYGIRSIGGLNATVIERNKIQSDLAIYITGTSGSGGNRYIDNLLQSRTGSTGTPVGQGITLVANLSGEVIRDNYIERFNRAVEIAATSVAGTIILDNEYDNNTTKVNSASADYVHSYYNNDGTGGDARYGSHEFNWDYTNTRARLKNTVSNNYPWSCDSSDRVALYGEVSNDVAYAFSGNGETMQPGAARMKTITGSGSARSGAILGVTGAVNGQRLLILGNSWAVTFAATNCTFSSAGVPTFGNNSGNVATMELVFCAGDSKWYEVCRTTRP